MKVPPSSIGILVVDLLTIMAMNGHAEIADFGSFTVSRKGDSVIISNLSGASLGNWSNSFAVEISDRSRIVSGIYAREEATVPMHMLSGLTVDAQVIFRPTD